MKKFIALLISTVLIFILFAGCSKTAKVSIDYSGEVEPLTASGDAAIQYNPDRGFRTHLMLYIADTKKPGVEYDNRTVFCDMTEEEMLNPKIIKQSRIQRIARGSGHQESDVKELLKYYNNTKKTMKGIGKRADHRGPGQAYRQRREPHSG